MFAAAKCFSARDFSCSDRAGKSFFFISAPSTMASAGCANRNYKKNTRKMNKVKKKSRGRPLRSDTDIDLEAVGRRIRQLRGQSTQEEFAKLLSIGQAQLSKYELGQSAPPLGVLARLAKNFGKSVDWMLTGHSD